MAERRPADAAQADAASTVCWGAWLPTAAAEPAGRKELVLDEARLGQGPMEWGEAPALPGVRAQSPPQVRRWQWARWETAHRPGAARLEL
jgi:hypothetical protein